MTAATSDPCSSNGIFAAAGVLPLKNVIQACRIWFAAPSDPGPPGDAEDGGGDATGDGDGPAWPAEDSPPQPAPSERSVHHSVTLRHHSFVTPRARKWSEPVNQPPR